MSEFALFFRRPFFVSGRVFFVTLFFVASLFFAFGFFFAPRFFA